MKVYDLNLLRAVELSVSRVVEETMMKRFPITNQNQRTKPMPRRKQPVIEPVPGFKTDESPVTAQATAQMEEVGREGGLGTANKKRGRKPKQPDLPAMTGPGVEKGGLPDIDEASEDFVMKRDERMRLTEMEKESKDTLLSLMHKHELKRYDYDADGKPRSVTVTPKDATETLKVKTLDTAGGESDVEVGGKEEP